MKATKAIEGGEEKFYKRLESLFNSFDVLTQILSRGDLEITAFLLEKIMKSLSLLIEQLKKEGRQNAAYVDVLLETRMPQFQKDLDFALVLGQQAEAADPLAISEKDLMSLTTRVGEYIITVNKGVSFLHPRKGLWQGFLGFWKKNKKSLLVLGVVAGLVLGGFVSLQRIQDEKLSLRCEIFTDQHLSTSYKKTKNKNIDFDWGYGSPFLGFKVDDFSMRWTGFIQIPKSGPYEFTVESDDGVVLWVDDQKVIEDWTSHSAKKNTSQLALEPGCHAIKLEYFENNAAALIHLSWKGPDAPAPVIIPQSVFRSEKEYCSQP